MADNNSSHEKVRGKHPTEEIIYQRLVNAIIDKRLRPGQHLNEVKLAESFDIPRSRVRRVLERLRDENIIEIRLHHGAFISRPTVEDARYVFEARRHLEHLVIQLACERATAKDIESLRALLEQERSAFDAHRSDVNRMAAAFHLQLAHIAGNPVIERMVGLLIQRCILVQSVYETREGVLCLTDEHLSLVDSLALRDVSEAQSKMHHHFEHIFSSLDLSSPPCNEIDIYDFL
ncbi:TPA: GntR family transcriptional regulator [Klebsiella quasipneumoniae subsp. quasipneumoniae]|nr:GntR family transcriptional regulator [Klebsiella quasipneumoniae subsp. quasipneumoniae]